MIVAWSEGARADLRAIEAYIAQDAPRAARRMIQKIITRCERLTKFPRSGPVVDSYAEDGLREITEKPYRMIYRIHEQEVEIVAVVHASRELPSRF